VAYVLNKMSVGGFRHVPVIDDEHRPVCVISVNDVVTFLVNAFPREVLNLPEPGTTPPASREGA
ncbi:MAG: CBS domain-containing protein, partial [Deltaproteobacteria bacterium]